MSWRTNRFTIGLRTASRALGLNRVIERVFNPSEYEVLFKKTMLASIRPGDCVWDIGANVGFYSALFADIVGTSGKVFAFEPSAWNSKTLHENTQGKANITILPFALGEREALVSFQQGEDALGATSRIVESTLDSGGAQVQVRLVRGDKLIEDGVALSPSFIKIDTEGFELDVLKGLQGTLTNPALRTLCIEVHFGLLNERGLPDAPSEIESLLKSSGFRCKWSDASHIIAARA